MVSFNKLFSRHQGSEGHGESDGTGLNSAWFQVQV